MATIIGQRKKQKTDTWAAQGSKRVLVIYPKGTIKVDRPPPLLKGVS